MTTIDIPVARVFLPLLESASYKGAYGGRGSGKSHFLAGLVIRDSICNRGMRTVCIREVQKTLMQSAKSTLEGKLAEFRLGEADGFKVYADRIATPGDGIIIFQGMQDHTAESIKSLEGFGRAWVEEAQTLSKRSLDLLIPTIRVAGSSIAFSWNPRKENDPVDVLFRGKNPPKSMVCVRANWSDNPWWNDKQEEDRLHYLAGDRALYDHIYEGEYARVLEGAYYAESINEARRSGRITNIAVDPLVQLRAYWDIGGAGAKADANAIWVCQFVDRQINVLDYIEGQGQVLGYYVDELRRRGYGGATCFLPHDGLNTNNVSGKRYADHLSDAGFTAVIIPNQGMGAAMQRIEALRRLFPRMWFDHKCEESGLKALGFYHERRDDKREVGLGPEHDWSSHCADAAGLMAIDYQEPKPRIERSVRNHRAGAWMGA